MDVFSGCLTVGGSDRRESIRPLCAYSRPCLSAWHWVQSSSSGGFVARMEKVRVGYSSHRSWKCHHFWRTPCEIPRRYSDIAHLLQRNRAGAIILLKVAEGNLFAATSFDGRGKTAPRFSAAYRPPTAHQPGAFDRLLSFDNFCGFSLTDSRSMSVTLGGASAKGSRSLFSGGSIGWKSSTGPRLSRAFHIRRLANCPHGSTPGNARTTPRRPAFPSA